jgi:acetamidase/formamidase
MQAATTEMYRRLQADYGLDQRSAAILMGMCVKYEVGNVVDPAWTMVCKMPKSVLRRFGTSPYDRQGQEIRAAEKP